MLRLEAGGLVRMVLLALVPVAPLPAWSQPPPPSEAPSSDLEIFEPGYFDRFSPQNAEDMVRQVPGFSVEEGDSVRGFGGAAGNVLINGERPSTKTRLRTLLSRIPVNRVLRIELVTGNSAQLDMRGQTRVVNVVLKSDFVERTTTWETTFRNYQGGRITGDIETSSTLPLAGGTLSLSGEFGQSMTGGPGGGTRAYAIRNFYDGDGFPCDTSMPLNGRGVPCEVQDGLILNERLATQIAGEFTRKFDWGKVHANAEWETSDYDGSRFYAVFAESFAGQPVRYEPQTNRFESNELSLSGDAETQLWGGTLKVIVVHERNENVGDNLFEFFNGAGAFTRSTLVANDSTSGENIVRGEYSHRINDQHAVEFALEGVYNFLDSTRRVTLHTGVDATPPGSDTIVEETRYEAQISDVWTVSPTLRIEPGFKFEVSSITQEARLQTAPNLTAERDFTYPKPIVTATWRPSPQQQLRLSLEREVAQLDFNDFVTSVEVQNERVDSGNSELVPAQAWAFDAAFEQKFWGEGRLVLRGSYDEVEDVQDVVPVIPLGGTLADASDGPGNLGDGTRWNLGFSLSVPTGRFGIRNGRLDIDLSSGNSEVLDPVTGLTREFSNEFNRQWELSFRQDFPAQQVSYGFRVSDSGGGTAFRLEETFKRQRTEGDFGVFVETTRFAGLNIRLGYFDIFDPAYVSNRVIYNGPRSTGVPVQWQESQSANGPFAFLRIAGTL